MKTEGPFHVVKHSVDDEFVTYSIYINNRRYLKPEIGWPLGRRAAYGICRLLNSLPWPEPPATREELLAVR
jgi:hypothetical protein